MIFFKPRPQEDNSEELETVEVFKVEHYAAALRREYVESYESRNPPFVSRAQLKKSLSDQGECSPRSLWSEAGRWKVTQVNGAPTCSSCRLPAGRKDLPDSVGSPSVRRRHRLRRLCGCSDQTADPERSADRLATPTADTHHYYVRIS